MCSCRNTRQSEFDTDESYCYSWKLLVSGLCELQLDSDFHYATQGKGTHLLLFIFTWAIKSSSLHHRKNLDCFLLIPLRVDGYRR